ncbi:MAG: STAS domain-containing protein [Actinobacteria bacterium]|nr:STAS domain-containing protein [Actinomycetota bacterium]
MRLLEVEISRGEGGGTTLSLSGELDLSTIEYLENAVDAGVDGRPELVVLDLRGLTFLDSAGLRLMLRLNERLRSQKGRLVLVQGSRRVHRVFELTLATEELEIVADPADIAAGPGASDGTG